MSTQLVDTTLGSSDYGCGPAGGRGGRLKSNSFRTPMTTSRTGQVLPIPHPGRNWSARNITPSTIRITGPVRPCRVRPGSVHGLPISRRPPTTVPSEGQAPPDLIISIARYAPVLLPVPSSCAHVPFLPGALAAGFRRDVPNPRRLVDRQDEDPPCKECQRDN